MTEKDRVSVSLDPAVRQALRRKAAETGRSVSYLVNSAVKTSLAEDEEDLTAFADRAGEQSLSYEDVLGHRKGVYRTR